MNYYNEIDKSAANWIRQLIKDGLIPPGDVDERSIVDVKPEELKGYAQCHFFCGIAGWPLALQLSGWPADRPVWTGSCPCQPFSSAGKGLGQSDERHLWPAFFNLIRECRPQQVFGEQVASAIGHGWLDGVSTDLESENYTCGASVLGAHSVGAPHIRQRLYWVANANYAGPQGRGCSELRECAVELAAGQGGSYGGLGDSSMQQREWLREREEVGRRTGKTGGPGSRSSGLGEPDSDGRFSGIASSSPTGHGDSTEPAGFWSDSRWLLCRDGKHRRVPAQPALFPLADGLPYKLARRGSIRPALLKGAGNAIVPQVAAEFVMAFMEIEQMNQKTTIQ